ncbi:MAG: serine hydrolase domain-containing protein [Synoicihabitans sp.]
MKHFIPFALLAITLAASDPHLPEIGQAMQHHVDAGDIAGAVTMVVSADKVLHLEATGLADRESGRRMSPETLFDVMSMTKPLTGIALLILQDQGKLSIHDPVAKYLPAFDALLTPSGQPANLTILQLMTHTSGLSEGQGTAGSEDDPGLTLADLVRQALDFPMRFEPGSQWKYSQSSINTAGRIVEVVSGVSFDTFLHNALFAPLGLADATFYPRADQIDRLATLYQRNTATGQGDAIPHRVNPASRARAPLPNAGLYATAPDYARICQMLLNQGTLDGHRILSPAAVRELHTPRTGDLKAGFVAGSVWGLGVGIVREPTGVTSMLSPGSYGHGGAYGTQAWIDPTTGYAFVLMIQRTNYGNGDDSTVRRDFQQAAVSALASHN